jgi:hypothetical protein
MGKEKIKQLKASSSDSIGILRVFANSIAKLLIAFNIPYKELFEAVRMELVKEISKQDPKITNVQLSVKTGMDRRDIARYKKSQQIDLKPSNMTLVMDKVSHFCEKNNTNEIPIKGTMESFYSFAEQVCNGAQTPKSLAKELILHNCLKQQEDVYQVINKEIIFGKNRTDFINILAKTLRDFTTTLIDNFNSPINGFRKRQFTMISTQIHPKHFLHMKKLSDKKINQFKKEYDEEVLLPFEEQIQPGVFVKPGTYPAFGVSSFAVMPQNITPVNFEKNK